MVLPSLFAKSSKKSKPHNTGTPTPNPPSTPGSPSLSSPEKKSHQKVKDRERDRRSGSYSSTKRSSKYDRDSHPLNLPPDELRRLSSSAMSAMADQQPMDIDRDSTASPTPAPSSPAAAPTPNPLSKPNGTNGDSTKPAPPPHRYTTSPPPQSANYAATPEDASPPAQPPTIDAEEYKAAGNKFFKIKDYPAAIKEYSKGNFSSRVLCKCKANPVQQSRLTPRTPPTTRTALPLTYRQTASSKP